MVWRLDPGHLPSSRAPTDRLSTALSPSTPIFSLPRGHSAQFPGTLAGYLSSFVFYSYSSRPLHVSPSHAISLPHIQLLSPSSCTSLVIVCIILIPPGLPGWQLVRLLFDFITYNSSIVPNFNLTSTIPGYRVGSLVDSRVPSLCITPTVFTTTQSLLLSNCTCSTSHSHTISTLLRSRATPPFLQIPLRLVVCCVAYLIVCVVILHSSICRLFPLCNDSPVM